MSHIGPFQIERARQILASHPAGPAGEQCPGCMRAGLPNIVRPCGCRAGAVQLLMRAGGVDTTGFPPAAMIGMG